MPLAVGALLLAALTASVGSATAAPPGGAAVHFHPGSEDLHDPLAPGLGNGGYDVDHYGIDLHYDVASKLLTGKTTIIGRLTQNLSRFNLDFALPVESVTVNGAAATFKSELGQDFNYGKELVVTPAAGLRAGSHLTVVVTYAANPRDIKVHGYSEWHHTVTGVSVWDEPYAASEWWYPGNDYPSDKATYDVTVTTDKADTVVTNGALLSRTVDGNEATAHWRSTAPMSSYLAFLDIGKYDVVRGTIPGGTPSYFAYERTGTVWVQRARRDVSQLPAILGVLQKWWGPYPFDVAGAVVNQTPYGTAFETQTRPTYTALYWQNHPRNIWAVVHEAAHQWYGDNVSMTRWRHIWLAEGFATYTEWAWSQLHGHGTVQQLFDAEYQQYPARNAFWKDPVIHPRGVLDPQAYERGAMTLQALRNRVGTADFFTIMRSWTHDHRHGNADSADFAALASRVGGKDLTAFFHVWLATDHRPAPTRRNGFPPGAAAALSHSKVAIPASFTAIARTDADLARQRAGG